MHRSLFALRLCSRVCRAGVFNVANSEAIARHRQTLPVCTLTLVWGHVTRPYSVGRRSDLAKEEGASPARKNIRDYLSTLSEAEQEAFADAEISSLDETEAKRLLTLQMEYDVWMSTGVRVPAHMTNVHWLQLLHTPTVSGRARLCRYWFKKEKVRESAAAKQELRQKAHLERQAAKRRELEEEAKTLGLPEGMLPPKPTILLFVRAQTMIRHHYSNLAWAAQHGQPLVLDLSLERHMKDRERTSVVRQILDAHGVNKARREPFGWVMTGLQESGFIRRKLLTGGQDFSNIPLTLSSQSYLDLFPAEQLVYLTPNSPNELLTWDPEAVYIVGALVDLADEKPVTFAKARRQNIRTARLPLDRFLMWNLGSKALTLDVLMKILCDIKDTGDWPYALRHVPSRKAQLRPQHSTKKLIKELLK